jgi:hypothetical protein
MFHRSAGATRRRLPILAACIVAAVPALALADEAQADVSAQAAKTMRFRVLNATKDHLTVKDRTLKKGHWRGAGPVDAAPLHVADFTMESESNDANGDTRWRIGDSDYLLKVWGSVNNPGPGSNCTIQDLDRKDVTNSPYTCNEYHTGGADSDQYTVVQPKGESRTSLVPGQQQRRQAYETLCGDGGSGAGDYASCTVDVSDVSDGVGVSRPAGDMIVNCSTGEFDYDSSWTDSTSETTTLGGSVGGAFNVAEWLEASVSATFEFNWTKSKSWSEGTSLELAGESGDGRHRYGWVASAPNVQVARAHVVAKAGNQTFDLPGVIVKAPIADTKDHATAILRSGYVPDGWCDGSSRVALRQEIPPVRIDPERVYSFGLREYNRRVVEVPGDNRVSGTPLELGQYANRPGQRWQLTPVAGYYQIHSDNDLDLCLDQWVANESVEEHTCKGENDPFIDNHLWQLRYGKTNESFELVSKVNGKVIGSKDTADGTKLVMVESGTAGVRTQWELGNA